MEKRYAIYTTDENNVQHSIITDCTADEAAGFVKLLLNRLDPNKPVDLTIRPYIKL